MSRRGYLLLTALAGVAVLVATGVYGSRGAAPSLPADRIAAAQAALAGLTVTADRIGRDDYRREAFGDGWSDAVRVTDGGNGCDTRNDVLARDLADLRHGSVAGCPAAVTSGELRSPYTGEFVIYRAGSGGRDVQIDHIVALAAAWDAGAHGWTGPQRLDFANDPANLVAVDAAANRSKGDREPARWMPPHRGFACQYAVQYVTVLAAYRLTVDAASARVLAQALAEC